jgi:hypothetical protein
MTKLANSCRSQSDDNGTTIAHVPVMPYQTLTPLCEPFARCSAGFVLTLALAAGGCTSEDDVARSDSRDAGGHLAPEMRHAPTPSDGAVLKPDAGSPESDSGEPFACTANVVFGVELLVKPEPPFACSDIRAIVRDGSYSEELTRFDCQFEGAPERSGTYDVLLEAGDRYLEIQNIVVHGAQCHVERARREVRFSRECTQQREDLDGGAGDADGGADGDDCVVVL